MKPLKLAVRKIVETVLRCGDIDNRYSDTSNMYEGAIAHQRIQKSMGHDYQKEVSLKFDAEIDGIPIKIQGRADGIITGADGHITIDEIKTTTLPLSYIYEQHELHLGQGKCYAYMLLQEMEFVQSISVQLTYYHLETEEIKRYQWDFTRGELDRFFAELLQKYGVWMRFEREWKILRNASIKNTVFPFKSYRRGQRELAVAAYKTIDAGKNLYAQAPTGIGKTLSALFPSIKAMGEEKCDKLFYLTAKTVTRVVAEDAVRLMASNGLRFKSVTLRAKDKICFTEDKICNPEHCPYAKGHYSRINDALLDVLDNNDLITPAVTEEYAKKHMVCPHEMALDISLWVDMVVGDYNHVFDPVVYLHRFFSDTESKGDYVFLIDEAHNMTDRVRDMYSATLNKSAFYKLKKQLKDKNPAAAHLRKAMGQINKYLMDIRKECEANLKTSHTEPEKDMVFYALVSLFTTAAEEWLGDNLNNTHELFGEILGLYFEASMFVMTSERYDEHYTTIFEIYGGNVTITLFCLDPSQIIMDKLTLAKASIFFSATLTPLPYYRETLGGSDDDFIQSLPSPFDAERILLLAHSGISTKYVDRERSYRPIAEAIFTAVSNKTGNYLVYFPSYSYMRTVYELFCELYPGVPTLLQQNSMNEDERVEFLERFDSDNEETLVGFSVLGGIFSEGIDLKGDRLIGSVIVGVGLPGISLQQEEIRNYYNRKNGQGYDFAYVFPGMNKVLQAAGRVIRTETDYGVIVLIDSRFESTKYKALYPSHWSHMKFVHSTGELTSLANQFSFF